MRPRSLAVALALGAWCAATSGASGREPRPWAYVYVFRTLQLVPLVGEEVRIGRLPQNDIVLTSERVSRRHAAIRRGEGGIEFVDVGSTNGSRHNGRDVRERFPVALEPGDRLQVADELLLFHQSLDDLWNEELRLRLLSSMVRLNVHLPQDYVRKSLGREEVVRVTTDAVVTPETAPELTFSQNVDSSVGFPQGLAAFVGNVQLDDGALELSLWALDGEGSMTSRRASISRLKHTTLRVALEGQGDAASGPWFPHQLLTGLFDVFEDDPDIILQFATSLASQDQAVALRDAAETLSFRHQLAADDDWKLLLMAAHAGGDWVDATVQQERLSLTEIERNALSEALDKSRERLEEARSLGAQGKPVVDAESAIERAGARLGALKDR